VKALGAHWDRERKSWVVPAGTVLAPFAKWISLESASHTMKVAVEVKPQEAPSISHASGSSEPVLPHVSDEAHSAKLVLPEASSEPVFLNSTFAEKDEVKALGARWDSAKSSWFVPAGITLAPFAKWISTEIAADAAITAATSMTTAKKELHKSVGKVKEPLGKPKKMPAKTWKRLAEEELALHSKTVAQLKDMLKLNDQKISGAKPELIARVAEGIVLGAPVRCPSCNGGKPNFDRTSGVYTCPGYMEDDEFMHCSWSSYNLHRTSWKE